MPKADALRRVLHMANGSRAEFVRYGPTKKAECAHCDALLTYDGPRLLSPADAKRLLLTLQKCRDLQRAAQRAAEKEKPDA